MVAVATHEDLRRLRRRARVSQAEIARRLDIAMSKVSEYETSGKPLPWLLTAEDYERALNEAIAARERGNEGAA